MEDQGRKRASAEDGGPPEKRIKGEPEDTEVYSQRIKKKMQANSRTGQACDRCKVRNPDHLVIHFFGCRYASQWLTISDITGTKDEMRFRPGWLSTVHKQKLALCGYRQNYRPYP